MISYIFGLKPTPKKIGEKMVTIDDQRFVPLPPGVSPNSYYVDDGWVWYIDADENSLGNYVKRPVFGPGSNPINLTDAELANVKPGLPMVGTRVVKNGDVIRSNWTGAIAKVEGNDIRLYTTMDAYQAAGTPAVTVNADMHPVPHLSMSSPYTLATKGLWAGPSWRSDRDLI